MGKYEETISNILEEWGVEETVYGPNGEDGFECETDCYLCPYLGLPPNHPAFCGNPELIGRGSDVRMINSGLMAGGRCIEFTSFDDFWDDFSNEYVIDPDTGEF